MMYQELLWYFAQKSSILNLNGLSKSDSGLYSKVVSFQKVIKRSPGSSILILNSFKMKKKNVLLY